MNNFQKTPESRLKQPPRFVDSEIRQTLTQPGSYNCFNEHKYSVKISTGLKPALVDVPK